MVPLLYHCVHSFLSIHSFVPSPARHLSTTGHRTTLQSITITSRKENIKEEEQRNQTEPPPAPTLHSPSTPTFSPPVSPPLSPPAQPSFLASLLARKRSTVTVPATKEVSPPSRGSSHPSPERLPYTPHSPFHLFSYDLDEEPSPPAPPKPSEESPKTPSPRLGAVQEAQRAFPCSSPMFHGHFLGEFPLLFLAFTLAPASDLFAPPLFLITSVFSPVLLTSLTARLHLQSPSTL